MKPVERVPKFLVTALIVGKKLKRYTISFLTNVSNQLFNIPQLSSFFCFFSIEELKTVSQFYCVTDGEAIALKKHFSQTDNSTKPPSFGLTCS